MNLNDIVLVMKVLFVCSTYYHTLISCVKAFRFRDKPEIMITEYISEGLQLHERLKESNLFSSVYFLKNPSEYTPKNKFDKLLNLHRINREKISDQIDFDFTSYDEIHIFHDDIWVAHYLKDKRIKYNLIEDALDSLKIISDTPFRYMIAPKSLKEKIKRLLNYGYIYFDNSSAVKSIEVNDKSGIPFKRIVEVPRKKLFQELSSRELKSLENIFCPNLQGSFCGDTLLLTEPFSVEKSMTKNEQEHFYLSLAKSNLGEVYLKPHPRDECCYENLGGKVLPKNIPLEILFMLDKLHFAKIVVFCNSTVVSLLESFGLTTEIDYYDI